MAKADKDMAVGLDVGASGITVAVLNPEAGAGQEVAGLGFSPSIGFDRGAVTGLDDAIGSVRRAVAEAELTAGVNISFIHLCSDMPDMLVRLGSVKRQIDGSRNMGRRELLETHKQIINACLPAGYAAIQLTGFRYYVDGKPVSNYQGAGGGELKVEAVAVAAGSSRVEELHRCFTEAGLRVKQTVAGPLAAAAAILDEVEQELGVLLVDIGAGMTRAAYINHGSISDLAVFPAGAGHITSDLAVVLRTTLEEAEKVKTIHGLRPVQGHIKVRPISGSGERNVSGDLAHRVIKSRLEEIFEFINGFVRKLDLTDTLPGGIVFTGGGSRLAGILDLAGECLSMPVRGGTCRVVPETVSREESYRYTNAIGLALRGAGQRLATRRARGRMGGGIVDRLFHWLQ